MRALLLVFALAVLAAATPAGFAADAAPKADAVDPRVALAARIPGVEAKDLRPSPVPGIYELSRGAEVTYLSADGRFIFTGDLYQISTTGEFPNLSDARRRELRTRLLGEVPDSRLIVFAPKTEPKYTITVFTDPDCSWCRKLHSQIAEYNRLGIKVRYAFFPREGPGTEAWTKSEAVWCSADRKDALTRAKLGQQVKAGKCANTPVKQTWELGREIGIEGTPGVVLANGELIPGYLPPQQMLAKLAPPAKAATPLAVAPTSPARR
jgi:thiol:disulfide interchange protein DsbC